jgi:hypothetical protein
VEHAGKSNKDEEVSLSLNLAWWRRKSERKEMSLLRECENGSFQFKSDRLFPWNQAFHSQFLGLKNGIFKHCMLSDVNWECAQEKLRRIE